MKKVNPLYRYRTRLGFIFVLSALLYTLGRPLLRAEDTNKCLEGITGNFIRGNEETECLKRICSKEPFSWIRWGDGETLFLSNSNNSRLRASFYVASHHPSIFLNVGSHWLCEEEQNRLWNSLAYRSGRYYDYFYLNMGDPLSRDNNTNTIKNAGWRHYVEACDRKVLAVIPAHLDNLPIFQNTHTKIVRSPSYTAMDLGMKSITRVLRKSQEPYVVLLADGALSKMMATELTLTHPNHTYIDIGSSLDGYAGVHSRDYNDPNKYCDRVKSKEERDKWFAPGVCLSTI